MGARYSASFTSVTTAATADTANLANTSYPAIIQGGSGTQRLNLIEVYMGGEASASSAPQIMVLGRDSTVGGTVVAGSTRNALLDGSGTAPATTAVVGNSATTLPQRSSTLHLLHLSFNAYGGIVRWVSRQGEEPSVVGNTQPLGEVSLSAYTGTTAGNVSGHVLYEVV
jgi:hypothetical protein